MREYSRIKEIEIKDFRSLEHVHLKFDGKNVITLMGNNESGKTSIVKAIETCLCNSEAKKQKNFIRDYQNSFAICIGFEDGTEILRHKTSSGVNIYKVKFADGHVEQFDRIDNTVPYEIEQYLGMCYDNESDEVINIRTANKPLIMVNTASSTNYKLLYNLLHAEDIYKAIKVGNREILDSNNELRTKEELKNYLGIKESSIKIFDTDYLNKLSEQLQEINYTVDKQKSIIDIIERNREIFNNTQILKRFEENNIEEIDTSALEEINKLLGSIEELNNKKGKLNNKIDGLEEIDEETIEIFSRTIEYIDKNKKLSNMLIREDVNTVDVDSIEIMGNIIRLFEENNKLLYIIKNRNDEIEAINSKLEQVRDEYTVCPNCGEYIRIGEHQL